MASHRKESQIGRFAAKRLKSMEVKLTPQKPPKIKRKATRVIQTVLNLLQNKENRKQVLTDELSFGCANDLINNHTSCQSSSLISTSEIPRTPCAKDKANLSKSWSYFDFVNDPLHPDLENKYCVNKEATVNLENKYCVNKEAAAVNGENYFFMESYFEDDYWQDYHDDSDKLTSPMQLSPRGIKMGLSSLQSPDTKKLFASNTVYRDFKHSNVTEKSLPRRQSLPNFLTQDACASYVIQNDDDDDATFEDIIQYEQFMPDFSQYQSIAFNVALDETDVTVNSESRSAENHHTLIPNEDVAKTDLQVKIVTKPPLPPNHAPVSRCSIFINNKNDIFTIPSTDDTKFEYQNGVSANKRRFSDIQFSDKESPRETSSDEAIVPQSCIMHLETGTSSLLEDSDQSNTVLLHNRSLPDCENHTHSMKKVHGEIMESQNQTLSRHISQACPSGMKMESPILTSLSANIRKSDFSAELIRVLDKFDDRHLPKISQNCQVPNFEYQTSGCPDQTALSILSGAMLVDSQQKSLFLDTQNVPVMNMTSCYDNSKMELECETRLSLPLNMDYNLTKDNNSSFESQDVNNLNSKTICTLPMLKHHLSAEHSTSGTSFKTNSNLTLPDFCEKNANGNSSAYLRTATWLSRHTNQEVLESNCNVSTLTTSSPMCMKQGAVNSLLHIHDFVSPIRQVPDKQTAVHTLGTHSLKRKRRLRKKMFQHDRSTLGDVNSNHVARSDEKVKTVSNCNIDYILLKRISDWIVDRIPLKKYVMPFVNIMGLMDYLHTYYMNEISHFPGGYIQTISDYREVKTQSSSSFTTSSLNLQNCLSQLLDSVLVSLPSIVQACCDFMFENLSFLMNCPDFYNIPPELLLLFLCNDRCLVLGHQGFPLSYKESKRVLQKAVNSYIQARKSDNSQKNSQLEKMFFYFIDPSSEFKLQMQANNVICKRPYYKIDYQCSERFVTAENTRQEYLFQPHLSSVICSYRPNGQVQSPVSIRTPENEIREYCTDTHTLRKIYFSYRRHNLVPYITQIQLQYIARGRKATCYIGQPPHHMTSASQQKSINSSNCEYKSDIEAQSLTETLRPDLFKDQTSLNPSAGLSSPMSGNLEDDSIISKAAEELQTKKTVIKLAIGEHVTGIMLQGNSVLHNIMIHTNKGRHIRAHGILDFPCGTVWTSIPPPENSTFCLQAISANTKTVSARTYIRDICAVWAVLSVPFNNLNS